MKSFNENWDGIDRRNGKTPRKFNDFVSEAKAPGQTMAQKHDAMFYGTAKSEPVGLIKFTSTILKDWKSGNMSFGRLEQVIRSAFFIFMKGHGTDPASKHYEHFNAIRDEFTKKYPEIDRILRFGKSGYKLNVGMGNVTPNEIVKALETILVFAKKDMPALVKAGKIPPGFDPLT